MDNYELFKSFLDTKGVHYNEDTFDDGDRMLIIPQKSNSGALLNILVIFSEIKIKILVMGVASVEDEDKKIACYKLFNDFNMKHTFFKMFFRRDDICVESDFSTELIEGDFNPKELMNFIMAALFAIDKNYRDIMKIVWF